MRQFTLILICLFGFTLKAENNKIVWEKFDDSIFIKANEQNKFILLTIGAAWCHWCHVMDQETYSDQSTINFLQQNFILVREDQDSRPDLFSRYKSYGWPAIIIFDEYKNELLKLRGYQNKEEFINTLEAFLKNPNQFSAEKIEPINNEASYDKDSIRIKLYTNLDRENGGLKSNLKYLHLPTLEYFYFNADTSVYDWLKITIYNSTKLIDPVWSGMYQYSTMGDWEHPHYEKLLRVQSNAIYLFSTYSIKFEDSNILKEAENIYQYCNTFLKSASPLFYSSQNADIISGISSNNYYNKNKFDRLKIGIPEVQKKVYLKENIMMCKSLMYLWIATNNSRYFARASINFSYIRNHFQDNNGLYLHEEGIQNGYYLEENLYVLESLILAYQLTQFNSFLNEAIKLSEIIKSEFTTIQGFLQSDINVSTLKPIYPLDLNCLYNILSFKLAMLTDDFLVQKKIISDFNLPLLAPLKVEDLSWFLLANEYVNANTTKLQIQLNQTDQIKNESFFKIYLRLESATKPYQIKLKSSGKELLLECNAEYCSEPIYNLGTYLQKKRSL